MGGMKVWEGHSLGDRGEGMGLGTVRGENRMGIMSGLYKKIKNNKKMKNHKLEGFFALCSFISVLFSIFTLNISFHKRECL